MNKPLAATVVVALVVAQLSWAPSSWAQSTGRGGGGAGALGLRPVQSPALLTLAEAFSLAARKSTDLRVADAQVRAARANITKAWAFLLPNISVGANATFNFPEQKAAFGSAEQFEQQALLFNSLADLTAQSAALTPDPIARQAALERADALRQAANDIASTEVTEFVIQPASVLDGNVTFALPLFNGRALPLLMNAYTAVELTKLSTQQARAAVLWAVAQAYLQAVATKNIVAIADEQVTAARRHHELATQRAAQGLLTQLAVERALLDVKKAEQQATQARGAQRMAKAALASLIGRTDDFDVEAPAPVAAIDEHDGVDVLLQRARETRLDLRVQRESVALAERARTEAWMRFLPSFQLVAQGRFTTNTSGLVGEPLTGAVIVQGSVPIFDGGLTLGTIDEASAKLDVELLRVHQLDENIERELRGSFDDVQMKKEAAATTAAVSELAQKQAKNAEELFAQGVATDNDVRDARLAHFAADVDATRARLDLEAARLGLAHATGALAATVKLDDVAAEALSADEATRARDTLERLPSP